MLAITQIVIEIIRLKNIYLKWKLMTTLKNINRELMSLGERNLHDFPSLEEGFKHLQRQASPRVHILKHSVKMSLQPLPWKSLVHAVSYVRSFQVT